MTKSKTATLTQPGLQIDVIDGRGVTRVNVVGWADTSIEERLRLLARALPGLERLDQDARHPARAEAAGGV